MKTIFKTTIILLFPVLFNAQTVISGKVTSEGKPIKDVNVSLKNSYDGATTDLEGNYSFQTEEVGEQSVEFSCKGFQSAEEKIVIESQKDLILNISLEKIKEIEGVVISVGRIEASDKSRTSILSNQDIYTTAGTNGEISSGYKYLPGVQSVGESEGLFVRGGTGAETKYFMDGSLVNNYYYNSVSGVPSRERFNSQLFKGSVFSSGGYSALYGQALSSVLVLESIDLPEKSSYDISVFPFSLGLGLQELDSQERYSFGINTSYSNMDIMKNLYEYNTDFTKLPTSFSTDFNVRIPTNRGGFLKYYGSFDTNSLGVLEPSLELNYDEQNVKLKANNTYHNLSFKQKWNKYLLNVGMSFSANENSTNVSIRKDEAELGKVDNKSNSDFFNTKVVLQKKIKSASNFKVGFETQYFNEDVKSSYFSSTFQDNISNTTLATFGELNLSLNNKFSTSIGLRGEYSDYISKWNIAPRASLAYKLSQHWVASFAYGQFYQLPETNYLGGQINQDYQESQHYVFQIQRNQQGRSLRIEAFYKNYEKLIKTNLENGRTNIVSNDGEGYAKGIELFWRDKKSLKGIDYWISYSYIDTKRDFLNYPTSLTPTFVAEHSLSLVAKKFFPTLKTGFNVSYSYNSGRPFYNIISQNDQNILLEKGKVKDYSSFNLSVNYLPNLFKKDAKIVHVLVAGMSNTFGTKNVYGYKYSQDGLRSMSIDPSIKRVFYVGWIFNIGVDRSQEVIDSLLK